jgi:hypothetical protein
LLVIYRLLITWWLGLAKGRKRGEEVEGPPADGSESYNGEVSPRGAEQKIESEDSLVGYQMSWKGTHDAGEGTVKRKAECSLPRVLK